MVLTKDRLRVAAEYGNTMGQDSVEYEETRYGDTYTGVECQPRQYN